ncbi:MAG TPA: Hpt domain-containing protein, partial [bacterium]
MEPMDEITESLVDAFRDEARELLVDMEAALLELEGCPGDQEQIARAFRALHTLKGNGAMFGFEELERFAHTLEHVFDLLRKGQMAISQEIIDLTLGAKDRLLALLTVAGESPEEVREREDIGARIARVLEAAGQAGTAAGGAPAIPVPSRPAPGPPPGA